MAYTTFELVIGKSLLGNEPDLGNAVENFIAEAQARIDARLRKRYVVPLAEPVPAIIESIATNFAAGFLIERDYSNRPDKTEPYLAEVLIKRAEADLLDIMEENLLDGMEGVVYAPVPGPASGSCAVRSTTPQPSDMERALEKW